MRSLDCRTLSFTLAAAFTLAPALVHAQAVIYVDGDAPPGGQGNTWATAYDSLSDALAAAGSGDQIWVAAGRYVGNFTLTLGVELYGGFTGTETDLAQRDWTANPTILDGDASGSVVTSPPGATATTRIDGFTITNGFRWGGIGARGGGLRLVSSSPTIANNIITGNHADEGGGALYLEESTSARIVNNRIIANSASGGGGLFLLRSSPTIANNTIAGNGAGVGGGLRLARSSPTMTNNTIAGNSAGRGGGLDLWNASPIIANTVVAFNTSGIYVDRGDPSLRYSCVYGNDEYDYSGLTDPTGTNGNISNNPLFADLAYGNLHIQPDSPCVDGGNNADAVGDFDIDGEPRIHSLGGTVDMGADESYGVFWQPGPYGVVRVSPHGDDANDGSSWALAKRTVQAGINAASALGGEVWVQAGSYRELITLPAYAYVYGGFGGVEAAREERDWNAHVTILDGQQQGSVVVGRGGRGTISTIDGFTIINGSDTLMGPRAEGGGLYMYRCSARIANNSFRGNTAEAGGGVHLAFSSSTVANNTITGNAADNGGGMYVSQSSPTIANNTIVGNSADDGGGLFLSDSSPTIANTIVAFNKSGVYAEDGTPTLRHNCVYGNDEYDYSGLTDPTGTDGNISADPLLGDLDYGNVHIQPDSPCVDAGSNADAAGDVDIDGEPRIDTVDGTVDIGSDESDGTTWPAGPYVVVRVSPDGDDANDGSSWALAKRSVQGGVDVASAQGGEVWVQAGVYEERISLHPYAYVYGGFAGNEFGRNERDWRVHVTTLDAQRQGTVVTARAGYGAVGTVDGFTVTNGVNGLDLRGSFPTIANNNITGNRGRGLYLRDSSPTIANNTIAGNGGVYSGGGLYMWNSSPFVTNNTITGNIGRSDGGAVDMYDSSATIVNTVIAFNSSGIFLRGTGTPTLRHNCVYGNTEYDYSGLADPTGTNGNLSADPLLADTRYGNVHIQPDSPCVDTGSNADVFGEFDVDAEPRIHPFGGTADIGADESDGTLWAEGPYTIVRVSPGGDDANDGSSWALAKRTVQAGVNAASVLGGEVWVQAGTYEECITLYRYASLYGGFAGGELERVDRDWAANVTTLDGQQNGSVVSAQCLHGTISAIDGFTITNGSADDGGGLYLWSSSMSIANNNITNNSVRWGLGGGIYLWGGSDATIATNTITGNSTNWSGGGMYLESCSPAVTNNTITDNHAGSEGGGLNLVDSFATIANNTIMGNSASTGGGMDLYDSSPTIANNVIAGNTARWGAGLTMYRSSPLITGNAIARNSSAREGGGLLLNRSSPTIANNIIIANFAGSDSHFLGRGGGLYAWSSSPTITNNIIKGNSAGVGAGFASGALGHGGGLYLNGGSDESLVTNNVITCNHASSPRRSDHRPSQGGGLYVEYGSWTIANNTITGNRADSGGGVYGYRASTIANNIVAFNSSGFTLWPSHGSSTTLRHNCVYGNAEYDYSGIDDPTGTDGNISADPLLVDLEFGHVHIQPASPCVDAGNNGDAWGDFDMDGEPRIQQVGGTVDIGADESDGTVWSPGPVAIVRVSPDGDDANDGSSWELAKRSVQAGIDAASSQGGEVWVRAGYYEERIALLPYVGLYGGFDGHEQIRDDRNWSVNVTTLDGQQQGTVVIAREGCDDFRAIDGFTITNGHADEGGGMYVELASPIVANNTITANSAHVAGGGLNLWGSSPAVTNNTITDNSAGVYGGGLYLAYSSPEITDNFITNNRAAGPYYAQGGGLALYESSPTIVNNAITGNSADRVGGGLYVGSFGGSLPGSSPVIAGNKVSGNSAGDWGGGLYVSRSTPLIMNDAITCNSALQGGGVFYNSGPDFSMTIANSTISGNIADHGGGGLFLLASSATIENSIVAFNSSGILTLPFGEPPTLRHTCVYGNTEYDYSGFTDPTGTDGNISADPLIAQLPDLGPDGQWGTLDDEFGDLRLLPGSPCIDAGDNAAVSADTIDFDGDGDTTEPMPFDLGGSPRFADDPFTPDTGAGTPPIVDMGSYEYQPDWLRDLEDAVMALNLPRGIERSLLVKLATASRVLDDDSPRNDVAACNVLRAFINAVQAQSGRHVPEEGATKLVEMARRTLEFLGCSEKPGRDSDHRSLGRPMRGR